MQQLLWPTLAALLGVALWWWTAPAPLTAVRLLRTPSLGVGNLVADRPDRACFVGTVTNADGLVRGPFSGEQAVAMGYEVLEEAPENWGGTWDTGRTFERVAGGSAAAPFTLDDGTGKLRVDPRGANFRLAADTTIRVDGGETPPERIRRFVAADENLEDEALLVSIGPLNIGVGSDRKYVERRVDPGDKVLVCGGIQDDRGTGARRAEAGTVPVVLTGGEPFLLADSSKRSVARGLLLGNLVWLLLVFACFVVAGLGFWGTLA